MDLNLTNLKDLDYICQIAADYFERSFGLPKETEWLQRISRYRQLIQFEIYHPEDKPNHFGALLAALSDEELIRLRRRLEKKSNLPLANILSDELEEREAIERAQHVK